MQREELILYIIECNADILSGLKSFFDLQPISMQYFTHPQSFLNVYDPDSPGCVLADIQMPDMSSEELKLILAEQSTYLPLILMAVCNHFQTLFSNNTDSCSKVRSSPV